LRIDVLTPCWVKTREARTAGAAAGISGRVIFAACWAGTPIKAFAKIATPRYFGYTLVEITHDCAVKAKSYGRSIKDPYYDQKTGKTSLRESYMLYAPVDPQAQSGK